MFCFNTDLYFECYAIYMCVVNAIFLFQGRYKRNQFKWEFASFKAFHISYNLKKDAKGNVQSIDVHCMSKIVKDEINMPELKPDAAN